MNVRQLEIFAILMNSRSVTEAANQLQISQPAVSKALRLLERELGVTLFKRRKGHLEPGPEAQLLYPEVQRAFKELDMVFRFADELRYGSSGQIKIAAAPTIAASLIGPAVTRFHQRKADVALEVRTLMMRELAILVADHQVDLGIGPALSKDIDARAVALCEAIDLCENEVVVALPEGHPMARRNRITPRDVRECRLVSFPPDTAMGFVLAEAFKTAGVAYDVDIVANQTNTLCYLVQAGAGIALFNSLALAGGEFPGLVIRPFRPRVPVRSCIYYSRLKPISRLAEAFIAVVQYTAKWAARRARFPFKLL